MNFLNPNQITTKENWLLGFKDKVIVPFIPVPNETNRETMIANILISSVELIPDNHYVYLLYTFPFCRRWIDLPIWQQDGNLTDAEYDTFITCLKVEIPFDFGYKRVRYEGYDIRRDRWKNDSDITMLYFKHEDYLMMRLSV